MRFRFSDQQEMFRRTVRAFADRELSPDYLRELDAEARAPHWEPLPKMAEVGLRHCRCPLTTAAWVEASSMLNFAIGFGCETVKRFGSEEQKQDLLPKIVSGEMCFAFSLTEPDAGSAAAIRTRAVADGDEYVINGTKIFTTGASEARCLVVATRTDIEADRHRGISLLIVDPKSEGITCRNIVKLGMRGAGGLYEVRYDGVRLSQAAYCIGCAQHVIDEAVRYAGERCIKEASMANLACTEALLRVTEDCIRVYGGYGLTMEFDIQRHFRDARLFVIGDGSSQIQRNLIARGMGL